MRARSVLDSKHNQSFVRQQRLDQRRCQARTIAFYDACIDSANRDCVVLLLSERAVEQQKRLRAADDRHRPASRRVMSSKIKLSEAAAQDGHQVVGLQPHFRSITCWGGGALAAKSISSCSLSNCRHTASARCAVGNKQQDQLLAEAVPRGQRRCHARTIAIK